MGSDSRHRAKAADIKTLEPAALFDQFIRNIQHDSHSINAKVNRSPAAREIVRRSSQSGSEGTKMIAEIIDCIGKYRYSGDFLDGFALVICEIWVKHKYAGHPDPDDSQDYQNSASWIEAGARLTGMLTPELEAHIGKFLYQTAGGIK